MHRFKTALVLLILCIPLSTFFPVAVHAWQFTIIEQSHGTTVVTNRQTKKTVRIRTTKTPTPTPTRKPTTTPTPTKTPTPTPTMRPTNTPTPTFIVQQVSQPTPVAPTPIPQPQSSDPIKDHIMQAINNYRKSKGLSDVKTDEHTCNFAKTRAKEIESDFSHSGFRSRIDSKSLPYPSYSLVTENIAMNSDYKDVVPAWIDSSGHAENMRKDTPFVCVERVGNYYAYEGWKP